MRSIFLRYGFALAMGLLCFVASSSVQAQIPDLRGKRILFLGDSITQNGAYVTFVEYYLNKTYPNEHFDIISIGLASETVSGLSEKAHPFPRPYLHERLWAALDVIKPSIVFACYGMNDGIYHPQSPERLKAFQVGIQKLIDDDKAAGAQTVLLTPPPFDALPVKNVRPATADDFSYRNPYDHYDDVLLDYSRWELSLPSATAQVIDLHTPLSDYIANQRKTTPSFHFANDGIHPNDLGHLIVAQSILKGIGIPVSGDPLDQELAKATSDPLYALVKKHRETRSNGWLSYIGYNRGEAHKTNSIDQTEETAADLQKQIDLLRAKG